MRAALMIVIMFLVVTLSGIVEADSISEGDNLPVESTEPPEITAKEIVSEFDSNQLELDVLPVTSSKNPVSRLIELTQTGDEKSKGAAFETLLDTKPWTPEIADAISKYTMREMNDRGRVKVASYLISGNMGKYAVRPLMKALASRSGGTRVDAIKLLGKIGADAIEAVPALQVVSTNDERGIQKVAKHALSRISIENMVSNSLE